MNFIFPFVIIIAFVFSMYNGTLSGIISEGISGADSASKVILSLAGTICFWSGILRIAEKGGAAEFLERLLSPIICKLFPKTNAKKNIIMNIIANLFGTGNAATSAGIAAMSQMDNENKKSSYPNHEMCRFVVMNTASLQLFPTTIISLLSSMGATNPFSIVPCVWISSSLALLSALTAEWLLCCRSKNMP